MSIVYAQFEVSIHGLSLTVGELESLRRKLHRAVMEAYPGGVDAVPYDDAISVVLIESAGRGGI